MLINSILNDAGRTLAGLLVGLALFRGIELAFPQRGAPKPERNLLGLRIWLIYVAVQVILTALLLAAIGASVRPASFRIELISKAVSAVATRRRHAGRMPSRQMDSACGRGS